VPSKSKAQHNLMAMVANNPKAAKRLGVSQSVGKEFMKADKRKGKKFALGGPTSYSGEDTGEGMKMSTRRGVAKAEDKPAKSSPSLEERYGKIGAEIRRLDPEAFKNRTDRSAAANLKLLRELREKKAGAPAKVVKTETETKVEAPRAAAAPARAPSAVRGRGAPGTREIDKQYARNRRESYLERINPLSGLSDLFGLRKEERVMRDMGVSREEARNRLANLEEVEEGSGMRRGGKVKKYAGGGSVSSASKRADGCATKGKTRGKFI